MAQGLASRGARLAILLAVVAAICLAAFALQGRAGAKAQTIGLFTTLPILWRESAAIGDLLASDTPPHFARAAIEARGRLVPLDMLAGNSGKLALPDDALLVMAQPRALAPAENVALDDWVRRGGRVLLFADPMLTAESAYALGDKRRPPAVALLSPILTRWGLELQFDDAQPFGERPVRLLDGEIPVNLPGRFVLRIGSDCALLADGLAARCRIGRGEVLAVADAALLESGNFGDEDRRRAMFDHLLGAFSH